MYQSTTVRVRKSILSMVVGKPISALSGLLVLVLLSRYLDSKDYGAYFTVWAMAEIIILASNFGLLNACYRYISAEVTSSGQLITEGPIAEFVFIRIISLLFFSFMVVGSEKLLHVLIGDNLILVINKYLILTIIVSEGIARFVEVIFDSMLCQTKSQLTLIVRTLLRLGGVVYIVNTNLLSITNVLMIEVLATATGALLAFFLIIDTKLKAQLKTKNSNTGNNVITVSRVIKFALPSYMAQLLGLLYGPDILKLLLNDAAGPKVLALFGFSFSIASIVQRYMPANLLAGVFRPAFVAASKKESSVQILSVLLSICMKVNFIFIMPIIVASYSSSDFILGKMSGGNYQNAGMVLTVILIGLLVVSIHLVLSMYCLALEKAMPSFVAAFAGSLCLPLAIYFSKAYGAIGIAFIFGLSELIWIITCVSIISKYISIRDFQWIGLIKLMFFLILSIVISHAALQFGFNCIYISIINSIFFLSLVMIVNVFSKNEVNILMGVFPVLKRVRV